MPREFKNPRSLGEIQQEYVQLCTKAGDLSYKVVQFNKDISTLQGQLEDLNFEAVAAQKKAAEEAKKAEETKPALKAVEPVEGPTNG